MSQVKKFPWKKSIVLSEKGIGVVTVRAYIRLAIS